MDLLNRIKQAEAADQTAARETYLAIVRRIDRPTKGDTDRLRATMATLGIDAATLERDIATIREGDRLTGIAEADSSALADEVREAAESYAEFVRETAEIGRQRGAEEMRRLGIFRDVQARQSRALDARRKLAEFRRRHHALLGLPAPEAEPVAVPSQRVGRFDDPVPAERQPLREVRCGAGVAGVDRRM